MSKFNHETNLPELPEGYHFSVKHPIKFEQARYFSAFAEVDPDKLLLSIVSDQKEYESIITTWSRPWYYLWLVEVKHERRQTEVRGGVAHITVPVQGSHPIAVQNAAYRALKLWNDRQAKSALVGDYPPKKLELG